MSEIRVNSLRLFPESMEGYYESEHWIKFTVAFDPAPERVVFVDAMIRSLCIGAETVKFAPRSSAMPFRPSGRAA